MNPSLSDEKRSSFTRIIKCSASTGPDLKRQESEVLALPLSKHVNLNNLINLSRLTFLICKLRILTPIPQKAIVRTELIDVKQEKQCLTENKP